MSTQQVNKITDLPMLVLKIMFRELSFQDLLNCRLVNKIFKEYSDNSNGINKLIIGQPDDTMFFNEFYWCYNEEILEDKDTISLKCFRRLKELDLFDLNKNLKYLKIYDPEFKLEELTNLTNLKCIEFGRYYDVNGQQILNLNLNNLKVFSSNWRSFELNAPKLEKIQFSSDSSDIKLNINPKLIKHLITKEYNDALEIFKSLEIMELRTINQSDDEDESLIIKFKKLKKLRIDLYCNKETLKRILDDKIKFKRSIDIYLEGIKIENIDKFNEYKSIANDELWKFRLNNFDLLDVYLPFINYIFYDHLEQCVNNIKNDLPSSFFDKFIHINKVIVYSVKDVDGLNWFLNKLKYLNELSITKYVSLDEVFYNNLSRAIRKLKIKNGEDINNYEFILKLSKLTQFYTTDDKDLFEIALTSIKNLKYLNTFSFYYKNEFIEIEKDDKYFYLNKVWDSLNYDELIEECNRLKLVLRSK